MGYFDGLTAGFFKKDSPGREVFYPRGRWGRGRIVPSKDDGAALRHYLKIYNISLLAGAFLVALIGGDLFEGRWLVAIGVYAVLAVACWMPMRLRVRTWQLSDERLSYRESLKAEARAHSLASLWGIIGMWLLLVALCVACFIYSDNALLRTVFGVCAGLCIIGGVVYLFMLRARKNT